MKKEKPRCRFCWECGRQLYGNHFALRIVDGHEHVLHKRCADEIDKGNRWKEEWETCETDK